MRGHNHVDLIGNLTADPEIRFTPSKIKWTTFHLAVEERRYKAASGGEVQTNTTFVPIVAWGKIAEICEKHLKKGMRIHLDGKLRINVVQGKDGIKKWYTSVLMREFLFLDSKTVAVAEAPQIQDDDSFPDEILGEIGDDDLSMLGHGQFSE